MIVLFATERLRRECTVDQDMRRVWGPERTKRLRRRLDDLTAAVTLADMRNASGRTHELTGDRAGQLAIDLDGPYRLVFEVADDPIPLKPDGGLDWTTVRVIRLLGVVDYHG